MRTAGSTDIFVILSLALAGAGCAVLGQEDAAGDAPTGSTSGSDAPPALAAAPIAAPEGTTPSSSEEAAGASATSPEGSPLGTEDVDAGGEAADAASPPVDAGKPPVDAGTPPVDLPPKPTATCPVTKDAAGFFTRQSPLGSYVAYVPPGYDGSKPMPLLVGMHGCGDDAKNYATWAVAPYDTRATQQYIGISLGSETGANHCWSMGGDDDKVLAAAEDIAKCFWVDPKKVVVSGFSSGGQLAYRVGLEHADRFAGIAIECSSLYAAGDADALLSQAPRKIPIAHRAHTSDTVFPLAKVKADWAKTAAAGFPISTSEVAGGHDGTSADWTGFLLPKMAGWVGL